MSLLNLYNCLFNDKDIDTERLDFTKDDDYKKFKDLINKCRDIMTSDNELDKFSRNLFGNLFNIDMTSMIDDLEKIGNDIHKESTTNKDQDTSVESKKDVKVPELPSKSTPIDKQENLHKIVGEYIDTYIRPYGNMSTDVVNDVYAGLFEFACWVLNR